MSANQHSTVPKQQYLEGHPSATIVVDEPPQTRATSGRVDPSDDPPKQHTKKNQPPPSHDDDDDIEDPQQSRVKLSLQDLHATGRWGAISRHEILGVAVTLLLLVAAGVTSATVLLVRQQQRTRRVNNEMRDDNNSNNNRVDELPPVAVVRDTSYYSVEAHYQALRDAIQTRGEGASVTATRQEAVATILTHLVANVDDLRPVDVYSQAAHWLMNEDTIPSSVESDLLPRFALAVTYYANGGGNGTPTSVSNWKATNEWMTYVDQCEWYGITCNTEQQVIEVDLSSNGLTGDMHLAWFLLEHCASIMLSDNAITGPVPGESFAGMPSLIYLHLQENALTGTVPLALKEATHLDTFFIQNNNITGAWPVEFCPSESNDALFYEFGMDCKSIECDCCTPFNCFN